MKLPLINSPRALARATIDDDRSPPRRVALWAPWREETETGAPVHKEVSKLLERRLNAWWTKPIRAEAIVVLVGMMISLVTARLLADSWNLHWIASSLLGAWGALL